jgi:hypothetical protein
MNLIGTAGIPNHNFLTEVKMKTAKTFLASSVVLGMAFGAAANAMAASPVGQWNITFYLEPGLVQGATQGVCYKADGTWYSTTFSNWNGDWFQNGDRLRWYGKTGLPLATAEFGQFFKNPAFAGEFAHFGVSGSTPVTSSRGNYKGNFVSANCGPPAAVSAIVIPHADPSK